MADDSLREKLDSLNEAVTDLVLGRINGQQLDDEGNPVPVSNDDLRVAMQLLKQNSISAAAIPDNPMDRMQKMLQGMRISPATWRPGRKRCRTSYPFSRLIPPAARPPMNRLRGRPRAKASMPRPVSSKIASIVACSTSWSRWVFTFC